EIAFKGFTTNPDSLIMQFEKNSIVLIVGHYVYEEDTKYVHVTLIQSVPISYSDNEYTLTPENLPNSSPLLFYSAPVVTNSYIPDNKGGRESFMLARCLYNAVTNNKHVDSKVIVSYTNENNHYNTLKNNLKKTVLSVIGHLKVGSKRLPHILASDIEWTYATNDPQPSDTSSIRKPSSQTELDTQLESIEERYATLTSQSPQKKQRIGFQNSILNKSSNDKTTSLSFIEAASQIQKKALFTESLYVESTSQVTSQIQKTPSTKPFCIGSTSRITDTRPNPETSIPLAFHITENTTFTGTDEPVELTHVNTPILQNEKLDTNKRRLRPLQPARK
ncbi:3494_t:CDS:2, partial [Cetraspora pellucida]